MAKTLLQKMIKKVDTGTVDLKKIADAINEGYVLNTADKPAYSKKYSFAPSKLVWNEGTCPRYWYLAFEGNEFENKNDGPGIANMQSGTDAHKRIGKALEKTGIVKWLESEVKNDNPPIYGFCDGLFSIDDQDVLIEIKTTNDRAFEYRKQTNAASDSNRMQLLMYMKILNYSLGAIVYENKNTHEILVVPVVPTQDDVEEVNKMFDWMVRVRKAFDDKQLPERVSRQGTKMCAACPLEKVCDSRDKGVIKIEKRKDFE